MRRIYWRKRLDDISQYWLSPVSTQSSADHTPLLLSEKLEERIVLAAPEAMDDAVMTDEENIVSGNVFNDNGNGADSDPDGDMFEVTQVNGNAANVGNEITLASGALLTLRIDGTFDYNPNGAFESLAVGEQGLSLIHI